MKLGEGIMPKLTAATIEKVEIELFKQRDLLIECHDVLKRLIDNGLYGVTPTDFDIIRALLNKLES